jgi:hypothetical protein
MSWAEHVRETSNVYIFLATLYKTKETVIY